MNEDTRLVPEPLMTPAEVAALFGVNAKTPIRWVRAGKIDAIRTPGGTHRFREDEIRPLLAGAPSRPLRAVDAA